MATGTRKREGGPVGEKKSEGGYASPSPSYIQARPPPPLSPVLLCEFALLLCKNPFHITYLVLCYCQVVQPQSLARVVQTERSRWCRNGVRGASERRCRAELGGRSGRGRGRAVVACAVESVTHLLRVRTNFAAPLSPLSRDTVPQSRQSQAHQASRSLTRHVAFLCLFSLFCCHRITQRYLCTRMNNQSVIDSLTAELQLAHAEMLAIRAAGIFGKVRLAACKRVIVAMEALCAAQRDGK